MKFYRKQPIEAEQFDGSLEMMDKYDIEPTTLCMAHKHSYTRIYENDWIITGVNGEHWKIADNVFQQQYAELPVIPKYVAECIINGHAVNDLVPIGGEIYSSMIQAVVYGYKEGDIGDWIVNHSDMFARAWLDGYQVEVEK